MNFRTVAKSLPTRTLTSFSERSLIHSFCCLDSTPFSLFSSMHQRCPDDETPAMSGNPAIGLGRLKVFPCNVCITPPRFCLQNSFFLRERYRTTCAKSSDSKSFGGFDDKPFVLFAIMDRISQKIFDNFIKLNSLIIVSRHQLLHSMNLLKAKLL